MPENSLEVILKLKDELFKVGLKNASNSLKSLENASAKIAQTSGVAFAGLGAIIGKTVNDFGGFERTLNTIKAVSSTTSQELDKIKQSSLDLGAATIFSNQEVANSYLNLSKMGFTTTESLAAMPGVLDAAAASGEGLESTMSIVAGTLRGFNLDASQSGKVADILAKAANVSNAGILDLGDGLKQVAPSAAAANQSVESVVAILAALSDRMIMGSDAGSDLKAILVNLQAPSKEAAKAMDAIGLSVGDASGKVRPLIDIILDLKSKIQGMSQLQQTNILESIAGKENIKSLQALISMPTDKLLDMQNQLRGATGAAKEMANTINQGVFTALERLRGSIESVSVKFGDALAPTIINVSGAIERFVDWLGTLDPKTVEIAANIALVTTAIAGLTAAFSFIAGPIIGLIANITSLVASMGGFAAVGATVTSLFTAIGASITTVLPVIAAVVAAIVSLKNAWDNNFLGIQDATLTVWDAVKDATLSVISALAQFGGALAQLLGKVIPLANSIMGLASAVINLILPTRQSKDAALGLASSIKIVGQVVAGILNGLTWLVNKLSELAKAFQSASEAATAWANKARAAFDRIIGGASEARNAVAVASNSGPNFFSNLWKGFKDTASNYIAPVKGQLQDLFALGQKAFTSKPVTVSAFTPAVMSGGGAGGGAAKPGKSEVEKAADKAAKMAEKLSFERLESVTNSYTQTLKQNEIQLEASKNRLSEYTSKSEEARLELDALKKEHEVLIAAQKQLVNTPVIGKEGYKQKADELTQLKNLIDQNKAAQIQAEKELTIAVKQEAKARNDAEFALRQATLEGENKLQTDAENFKIEQIKQALEQKKISEQDAINQIVAIREAQHAREIAIIDEEIARKREQLQAYLDAKGIEQASDAESLRLKTELINLEYQHKQAVQDSAQAIVTAMQGGGDKNNKLGGVQSVIQSVSSSFSQMIGGIVTGTGRIQDAFKNMSLSIVNTIVGTLIRKAIEGFVGLTKAATVGAATSAGAAKAAAISSGTVQSGVWAINAASAMAGVPIVGPALAKAAYAEAYAQGMATVGLMKGVSLIPFAKGTPNLPDDMAIQAHKGEMVVPATFAQAIRSGELSLSGRQSGQDAPVAGNVIQFNISFEGASFMGSADEMAAKIERALVAKMNLLGSRISFGGV